MSRKIVFALLTMLSISCQALPIVEVEVDGTEYTIATLTGKGLYPSVLDTLKAQKWWGDRELAGDLAAAIEFDAGEFGLSSFTIVGPMFAYGRSFFPNGTEILEVAAWDVSSKLSFWTVTTPFLANPALNTTYAIDPASGSAPAPGNILLLVTGLLLMRFSRIVGGPKTDALGSRP